MKNTCKGKVSDFKSWEEVREWLSVEGEYNQVNVDSWTFSDSYMSCNSWDEEYGPCCEDNYSTIDEALEAIKYYADDYLSKVMKM